MQGIKTVALKHLATALEKDANHIPSIVLLCQILFDEKKYDQIQKIIDKVSVLLREHDEIFSTSPHRRLRNHHNTGLH